MSDEKRQLDNMLEEVDELFRQKGLSEAVENFLKSAEVTAKIGETTEKLIENMKEMEANAPTEEVKQVAREVRTEFEAHKETIKEDVIASFKVGFAGAVELVLQFTSELEEEEYFLSKVRESIPAKGLEDIEGICSQMVIKNCNTFMRTIYRGYVPAGIPADVSNFIQFLFGGPMIPITAIFPEFGSSNSDSDVETSEQ